jgi:hypothetical protein
MKVISYFGAVEAKNGQKLFHKLESILYIAKDRRNFSLSKK